MVVFDGYMDGPSTKDVTHLRRTRRQASPAVALTLETAELGKKIFCATTQININSFAFWQTNWKEQEYPQTTPEGMLIFLLYKM